MNMTRTKREATIMVRQFGLDAVIKNGNRYKVANVEICGNCGRPAMLVNWFDVNKVGADHFISQGFKFYEGVTCEATTNDDGDDLCTGCVNQLKEQEAGKVFKFAELSPKASAEAVTSYRTFANERSVTLKDALDLLKNHFDWYRFDVYGKVVAEEHFGQLYKAEGWA